MDIRPTGIAERAAHAIEAAEWLRPLEDRLQRAVSTAFRAAGEGGRMASNLLHGTWLGHPLHPVLTDVPVGAWSVALVLDIADHGRGQGLARGADAAPRIARGLPVGRRGPGGAADVSASEGDRALLHRRAAAEVSG